MSPEFSFEKIETEEDFRARVLAFLSDLGVRTQQLRLEHLVRLRVGRHLIDVKGLGGAVVLRGRFDLLVVNDHGENLLLAELKRPGEALTDEDRDQAVSYARLQPQMPPVVLLSNGMDTRLYDVLSLSEIAEDGAARDAIQGGPLRATGSDMRLREEALQMFLGYSQNNVQAFCRAQQKSRMDGLRGTSGNRGRKYLPDVYVPRCDVRNALDAFLHSTWPVFVVAGPSGIGKTNEMCALAEEQAQANLSLFFSAGELADTPARTLADEFNWEFSDQLPLPTLCRRLATLARRSGCRVVVFLDGVDECRVPLVERSVSDLVHHFDRLDGLLQLVVSLKSSAWERFAHAPDGYSTLARRCFREGRDSGEGAQREATPSITLGLMAPQDRDIAVARHRGYFGLQGKLASDLLEMARDPFVLRVLSESCADGKVSLDRIGRDQSPMLMRYVEAKLSKVAPESRASAGRALEAVGLAMLEDGARPGAKEVHSVRESAALAQASTVGWVELPAEAIDSGLLIRERDPRGHAHVRFQYDRVRDYVIAYHALRLDALGDDALGERTETLVATPMGQLALRAFLDAEPQLPRAFLRKAVYRSAERFLDAYAALRAGLGRVLRSRISPLTEGDVGLAYSYYPNGSWCWCLLPIAAGQKRLHELPAGDSSFWDQLEDLSDSLNRAGLRSGGSSWQADVWDLLTEPERLAAEKVRDGAKRAVGRGGLDETVGMCLDTEKVLAIAGSKRRELDLPRAPWPRSKAADALRVDLLPVDLGSLRRRAFGALGSDRAYYEVLLRNGSQGEARAARKVAWEAAAAGERFEHPTNVWPRPSLAVLAGALDRLLDRAPVLTKHYLVLPDCPPEANGDADAHFEDGYSDRQLMTLIARLWLARVDEYVRVVEANLPGWAHQLPQYAKLPQHVIAFYQRPKGPAGFGLGGTLYYGALEPDAPRPLSADAVVESGRACTVQVFVGTDRAPLLRDANGRLQVTIPGRGPVSLLDGWSATSMHSFLGGGNPTPLEWRGEIENSFMPIRNSVYAMLLKDLAEVNAESLLETLGVAERSRAAQPTRTQGGSTGMARP